MTEKGFVCKQLLQNRLSSSCISLTNYCKIIYSFFLFFFKSNLSIGFGVASKGLTLHIGYSSLFTPLKWEAMGRHWAAYMYNSLISTFKYKGGGRGVDKLHFPTLLFHPDYTYPSHPYFPAAIMLNFRA